MADTTLAKAQPAAYTPRTNLDAAIASQPSEAWVAAAGPREHGFLIKIDDEYEFVSHRGDQFARPWQVERGALGTAIAAHGLGAAITVEPLGRLVQKIGPFPFAWNSTLDLDGSWHTLLALDPGIDILRTWAVFDADFDVADQAIGISILSGGAHSIATVLARYPVAADAPTTSTHVNAYWESEPAVGSDPDALSGPHGSFFAPIITTKTGALLVASYEQFTPTTGSCRVYAYITRPAA